MMSLKKSYLKFDNAGSRFRQLIVLSTISGKAIQISQLHATSESNLGIQEFEISFLRLIEAITNGSVIDVDDSSTNLFYEPGILIGGEITHHCNPQRPIGYYLEALVLLAPFTKNLLNAKLIGVTHDHVHPTVDCIKWSMLPLVQRFLTPPNLYSVKEHIFSLNIVGRSFNPDGVGEVLFQTLESVSKIHPVNLEDSDRIVKIRGCAFTVKVSPSISNRMINTSRSILTPYTPNIRIYTDHRKVKHGSKPASPGFGLCLLAESQSGFLYCSELTSTPSNNEETNRKEGTVSKSSEVTIPEDLASKVSNLLLAEILNDGCVDFTFQYVPFFFMSLTNGNVSKVSIGEHLTKRSISFLRDIKEFLNVTFKIDKRVKVNEASDTEDANERFTYTFTCVGSSFSNVNKKYR